jgi:hypothetical protein
MGFDQAWFNELRGLSDAKLALTRTRGIEGYVSHIGELRLDHQVSSQFYDETMAFVGALRQIQYGRFHDFFRAYPCHVVNFPRGKAFHQQWNIGLTAGKAPQDDEVRLGVGFRWNIQQPFSASALYEYLAFQQKVHAQIATFDQLFAQLGNYYEQVDVDLGTQTCMTAPGPLSAIVMGDIPPQNAWRFFGTRLRCHNPQDMAVISDHARLCNRLITVCDAIRHAGFGA